MSGRDGNNLPGAAGQIREGDMTAVANLLSLGMSGDILVLGGDLAGTEQTAQKAASIHGATYRTGKWEKETLGLSLTDLRHHGEGRLAEIAEWAAQRPHRRPARIGLRFLAIQEHDPHDEKHLQSIGLHSRQAGIHVLLLGSATTDPAGHA